MRAVRPIGRRLSSQRVRACRIRFGKGAAHVADALEQNNVGCVCVCVCSVCVLSGSRSVGLICVALETRGWEKLAGGHLPTCGLRMYGKPAAIVRAMSSIEALRGVHGTAIRGNAHVHTTMGRPP